MMNGRGDCAANTPLYSLEDKQAHYIQLSKY